MTAEQPPVSDVTGRRSQPNVVAKAERSATKARKTRADAERRRLTAWNARVLGASWREAAQIAGYKDHQTAMRAIKRWRGDMPQPEIDEARELARQRGENLWREAWRAVVDGKPGAVTAAVRVLHRQASLLGLDAPTKAEVLAYNGTDAFWSGVYSDDAGPIFGAIDAVTREDA